ncbi:MAG: hypothetical protein ACRDD7_05720 [Peptostreptococcaceae bacterium]
MSKFISKEEILNNLLFKVVDKNVNNRNLIMTVNKFFEQKGFSISVVEDLFGGEIKINMITNHYKMALCRACEEYYCDELKGEGYNTADGKRYQKDNSFKLENYFNEHQIHSYEGIIPQKIEVNQIILEKFVMKNDLEWSGYMTYEQIYQYLAFNRYHYNFDTQREPMVIKIGGKEKKIPSINKEAVDSIAEAVSQNKFEDTQIVLNCRINDRGGYKLIPNIIYEKNGITIANLEILQKLDVIDGMHRILGISKAYEEDSDKEKYRKNKIGVRLVVRTAEQCVSIVRQSFKRGDTGKVYLESLEENDYTKFVDKLIDVCPSLQNNVARTFSLAKADNKMTYTSLIIDMVKKLEIPVENKGLMTIVIPKISEKLEEIVSEIDNYIENNKDKDCNLLKNVNIFSVYMQISYDLKDKALGDFNLYNSIFDKIVNLDKKDIVDLKLNSEKCSVNKIVNYFL